MNTWVAYCDYLTHTVTAVTAGSLGSGLVSTMITVLPNEVSSITVFLGLLETILDSSRCLIRFSANILLSVKDRDNPSSGKMAFKEVKEVECLFRLNPVGQSHGMLQSRGVKEAQESKAVVAWWPEAGTLPERRFPEHYI